MAAVERRRAPFGEHRRDALDDDPAALGSNGDHRAPRTRRRREFDAETLRGQVGILERPARRRGVRLLADADERPHLRARPRDTPAGRLVGRVGE